MQLTFSIITVTYNAEKWLERTILSVLSQSYPAIEYIIIDGGSTDKTPQIIQQYISGIAYTISEPDKGLYDAMNKGMQKATGNYLWFINAGDTFYSSDTIQALVNKISKNKTLPDILYGETEIMDKEGHSLGKRRLRAPKKLTWKKFRMGMLVCHQSFVVKKSIAPVYDLQYHFSSDFDWCIRCLKKSNRTVNTHLILSCFLSEGMSTSNRKASLKERYRIMAHYYGIVSTSVLHIWFFIRFYAAKLFRSNV
jgi:glycosyltransferase involved in cell wall biosynthesis